MDAMIKRRLSSERSTSMPRRSHVCSPCSPAPPVLPDSTASLRLRLIRFKASARLATGLVLACCIAVVAVANGYAAVTPRQIGTCVELTTTHGMSITFSDLGLTRDQKKQLQARLATFNSVRGFQGGLDGLGLTAEQAATIQSRIDREVARQHAHPVGWPCPPFKHPQSVVAFVRKQLIYNGFRPAMTFRFASPRQITFNAIQDGIPYYGVVVKTGARRIHLAVSSVHAGGDSADYPTSFDA